MRCFSLRVVLHDALLLVNQPPHLTTLPLASSFPVAYQTPFRPAFRIAGVVVFLLFSLYPTIVASLASIFNCTTEIQYNGRRVRYLEADLTVVCYEGLHLVFVCLASVGILVYAIGIPLGVFQVTTFRSPLRKKDGKRALTCCVRRQPETYLVNGYRARYAFLFNGYRTDGRGFVVGWESLVMMRKLFVTLAGSTIKDPVRLA